eukprot:scaffold205971_cov35-Tisochrysis_lutea.AAC.2
MPALTRAVWQSGAAGNDTGYTSGSTANLGRCKPSEEAPKRWPSSGRSVSIEACSSVRQVSKVLRTKNAVGVGRSLVGAKEIRSTSTLCWSGAFQVMNGRDRGELNMMLESFHALPACPELKALATCEVGGA